jgi:hypothetical protein
MPDYDKGRIYKIVSESTDAVYVGSTIISLSKRFSTHNAATENGYNKCQSKEIIKHGDAQCILIEAYPCKSKEELHAREYHHIKKLKGEGVNVINIYMPTRTKKQYDQDNPDKKNACNARYREKYGEERKEEWKQYNKEYREKNAEHLAEQKAEYYEQNKVKIGKQKAEYNKNNKEKVTQQKAEYYQQNKEKRQIEITCGCGSVFNATYQLTHNKTLKHQEYLKTNNT